MVYFTSPPLTAPKDTFDVHELIGRLPESERFHGSDRYHFIADLLSKTHSETAYVEKYLTNLLEGSDNDDISDGYADTSMMVGGSTDYALRIVKWSPLSALALPQVDRVGLTYGFAHNHDFQLLTKGIFGDGYETEVYRTDASRLVGYIGEDVALEFQGRFKLSLGSVIWYERFNDVHDQIPPQTFSISLNIIPVEQGVEYAQCSFDFKTKRIVGFTRNRQARILSLLSLLSDLDRSAACRDMVVETALAANNQWIRRGAAALIAERWSLSLAEAFDMVKIDATEVAARGLTSDAFSVRHAAG